MVRGNTVPSDPALPPPDVMAADLRKLGYLVFNPHTLKAKGYTYYTDRGTLLVNAVRDSRSATRLAAGEGTPFEVLIIEVPVKPIRRHAARPVKP